MSERSNPDNSTTYTPRDGGTQDPRREAPGHVDPASTSGQTVGGPRVGGEPSMPGTREHQEEVQHTKGNSPMGISTALLWTVIILLIVGVATILFFTL